MKLAVVLMAVIVLGLLGWVLYRVMKLRAAGSPAAAGHAEHSSTLDNSSYRVSYAPPAFEWSGTTTGALPVKILTYKQHECLEDARNGFRIVGLPPTERRQPQPHKTRAHGLRTVASLKKHGFLEDDGEGGYLITDRGLQALEVCSVRY